MVTSGWVYLGAMIAVYGVANLLQSYAANRTPTQRKLDPGLLLRLAGHRTYIVGVICQFLGFLLAFLARRDLPLFLVQASMAAGLGVTAILGVLILKWRLPAAEVALLFVLCAGVTALVISAEPAPARRLETMGEIGLAVALGVIAIGGLFAVRLHGAVGSVVLGSLAGLTFGAAAVASRPLASDHNVRDIGTDPLLYLVIACAILGQLLLGLAMQRGSTTAAVAAMDAAATVPAAIIGLLFLGDRIWPGLGWLAAIGFLLTLGAVLGLTRYAEPQHHHHHRAHLDDVPADAPARRTNGTLPYAGPPPTAMPTNGLPTNGVPGNGAFPTGRPVPRGPRTSPPGVVTPTNGWLPATGPAGPVTASRARGRRAQISAPPASDPR